MSETIKEMDKYPFAVSYDNECSEFVVRFKQFREVIGAGDTVEEAIKEAFDNLEDYLDYCKEKNIVIPVPNNNVWFDDYSGKVTVRMPKALHRDLSEYCEKDGMSLNSTINDAIRLYLANKSLEILTNVIYKRMDSLFERTSDSLTYDLYSKNYGGQYSGVYSMKQSNLGSPNKA